MDRLASKEVPPEADKWGQVRPEGEAPWSILSDTEKSVFTKMGEKGVRLTDWEVKINLGILTGLNKAFLIDAATRTTLIAADANSANIIKPILRGRDIQRYRFRKAERWLIDAHNGYGNVDAVNIGNYPAIQDYLDQFNPKLTDRYNQGITSYNMRSCAYYEDFCKEKLIWIELVEEGRFAYDNTGIFGEASTYIMTGESLKYLCAVLNATLIRWYLQHVAPTSGMGTFRWKKGYIETIPIPRIVSDEQGPFVRLVDQILLAKDADANADTEPLEREIDKLVYKLYGLTGDEVAAVEKSLGISHTNNQD